MVDSFLPSSIGADYVGNIGSALPTAELSSSFSGGTRQAFAGIPLPMLARSGAVRDDLAAGKDWFEQIHILPGSIAKSNVSSVESTRVDVLNAYRSQSVTLTSVVSNAGPGTTVANLPVLPVTIGPMSGVYPASSLTQLSVDIGPNGPPSVDSTIDFVFNVGTRSLPIDIERVVVFPYIPEEGIEESLGFLTDVITSRDGREQRRSLRKNPRRSLKYSYRHENTVPFRIIENTLHARFSLVFQVPLWRELQILPAQVSAGSSTIAIDTTVYSFKVGGGIVLWASDSSYESAVVQSITPTEIQITSPLQLTFNAGAYIMPAVPAVIEGPPQRSRATSNQTTYSLSFRAVDNDTDLESTAFVSSFEGSPYANGFNHTDTLSESLVNDIKVIDNDSGVTSQYSEWATPKLSSSKSFLASGKTAKWNLMRFVHAIRGRQVAFFVPSDWKDIVPAFDLLTGLNFMLISPTGISQSFVQGGSRNFIRIVFNNGQPSVTARILDASVFGVNELLTLSYFPPSDIALSTIDRVEFVHKVRSSSDTISLNLSANFKDLRVTIPTVEVFE